MSFRALRAELRPSPVIPDASRFAQLQEAGNAHMAHWREFSGNRWWVEAGPGAVRLMRRNDASENATGELLADERELRFSAFGQQYGPPAAPGIAGDARRFRAYISGMAGGRRGTISGWSRESRTRMSYVLKMLDYAPLFDNHGIPAMVTLTMPGSSVWQQLIPTPKRFKHLVNRLQIDFRDAWGAMPAGVWKLEFQRRGAPHLHILMTPPEGRAATGENWASWLGRRWTELVMPEDAPVPWSPEAYRELRWDHRMMGTSTDYSKGLQDRSPAGVAVYFAKHGLFSAKDYQNQPPAIWRRAARTDGGVRYWGYWVLKKVRARIALCPVRAISTDSVNYDKPLKGPTEDAIIRRHLRKLAKRYGYAQQRTVDRVDMRTGEIRRRTVTRPTRWLHTQAGYISVPNGEQTATDIVRLLAARAAAPPEQRAGPLRASTRLGEHRFAA